MSAGLATMLPRQGLRRRDRAAARLRLWHLDHRLDGAWRRGQRQRDAALLAIMQGRIGQAVVATTGSAGVGGLAAEVTFLDGWQVRLGPCHGPAVAAVARLVAAGGPVTLDRAVRHPAFWELDFSGPPPDGSPGHPRRDRSRLALLAGSASESGGGEPAGRERATRPAPAPTEEAAGWSPHPGAAVAWGA